MSAIELFLKGKSKSFYYWWKLFIDGFEKTEKIDNSWKKIKINHTYYPENMPQLAVKEYQFNQCGFKDTKNTAIMEYIGKEYNKEFKNFKRYETN